MAENSRFLLTIGGADIAASAYGGAATRSATLPFSPAGASISVAINTSAGGRADAVTGNSVLTSPLASAIIGNYFGNGPGMVLTVSNGGCVRGSYDCSFREHTS